MGWKAFGQNGMKYVDWIILSAIVLFAFGLRFYRVGDVPAGIYCDEASIGYNAFALGTAGIDENGERWPFYIKSFGGYKNPVYIYSAILPIKIFGLSETTTRLTSVIFGTLTVIGIFWLCYEIWGKLSGFLASLLVSITPWHYHFSRIAFELISLPCFFVFGFAFCVRALRRGRWNWVGAGLMFGVAFHTYVMAMTFLPVFIAVFGLVYIKYLWRDRTSVLAGIILMALIILPGMNYRLNLKSSSHFKSSSYLSQNTTNREKFKKFLSNYERFFSKQFLFTSGDGLIRHNVYGHGELYRSFAPLILLGFAMMVIFPDRMNLLIFLWIALFPVGAAMTNDLYASRSIIGSPLAGMISGYGLARLISILWKIKWRCVGYPATILLVGYVGLGLGLDTIRYLKIYFGPYYRQSARGYYGFQFGYRDMIRFMESLSDKYPQKILTSTEVNQPYIFVLFYTRMDPVEWKRKKLLDYKESMADDYSHYNLNQPTLFALRRFELQYFEDYDVLKEVVAPDGVTEFVIADVRKRKDFIRDWLTLGLNENKKDSFFLPPPDPVSKEQMEVAGKGLNGEIKWEKMENPTIKINFNRYFGIHDPLAQKNPENCCADAVTYVWMDTEQSVNLEVRGSEDRLKIWINNQPVFGPQILNEERAAKIPIQLAAGWNLIGLRSCEGVGDWYAVIALTDQSGKTLQNLNIQSTPPDDFSMPDKPVIEEVEETRLSGDEIETTAQEAVEPQEANLESLFNPHQYYLGTDEFPDYIVVDSLDLEDPDSERMHEFEEYFTRSAPYQHNYHTKTLHYREPYQNIRLEDHGRRIYTAGRWIVQNMTEGTGAIMIVRYDQTGGATYTLKVNGKKLREPLVFHSGPESWNEIVCRIPENLVVGGENKFEISRTDETETDAEIYYLWFLQPKLK